MSRRVAFPFLTLPDEVIRFSGWMIGDPGQPLQVAGDLLEDWDYARDLEVASTLEIDWASAAEALAFSLQDIRLNVALVVGTGAGQLPRRQYRHFQRVLDASEAALNITTTVPGRCLSGRLRLMLQITLAAPVNAGGVLSPKIRGSRLWQNFKDILIEDGGDSRFPIEAVSFSDVFRGRPQEYSPWYLHWRPGSVRADFSGTVRLYVNSDFQETASRFVAGDGPTLQAVMGDVISQMIESILDEKDIDEINACEEGSVGQQIRKWLDVAFPGQELGSINSLRTSNPGAFRAAILASTDRGSDQ
jgi:hypothetical protein